MCDLEPRRVLPVKMTRFSRDALAYRRERKKMESDGYFSAEVDWRLDRGLGTTHGHLLDVKIAADGKRVWVKSSIGGRP